MFDKFIDSQLKKSTIPPSQYSPLVLAYIGDAVYELYVRNMLIQKGNIPVNKLHQQATQYVKAKSQSESLHIIEGHLKEEELAVFKRGRNAKSATVPKNADMNEYRHATGFEALIGYLYLSGEQGRLLELLELAVTRENN